MKFVIKFEASLYKELRDFLLQDQLEQICYLFCNTARTEIETTIFPQKIIAFPHSPEAQNQSLAGITLDKDMANAVYMKFAESDFTTLINCHSHPFENGNVWFSGIDDRGDISETEFILNELPKWKEHNNSPSQVFFLSMVFGQQTVAARSYDRENKEFISVDKIVILNDPIEYVTPTNKKKDSFFGNEMLAIQNRQILAFGEQGQKIISELKVAIVGIGGLGSILSEGLGRLGVRQLTLIDMDTIELSNLNRWQGAEYQDVSEFKVTACENRLKRMFPDISVTAMRQSLFTQESVDIIKQSDCLIGGLDNGETRYFLNRLSLQYRIPLIDSGVVIRTENSKVTSLASRLGLVIPGITRCFNCSGIKYYDQEVIRQFFLDAETRNNLTQGGYIKDVKDVTAPAVYPLNMFVSSMVLFEFHNLFTGFKPVNWNVHLDYLALNSTDKKCLDTINDFEPTTGQCLTCGVYNGTGDDEFLTYFLCRNKNINLSNPHQDQVHGKNETQFAS